MRESAVPIKDYAIGIFDGPHATPKPSDAGPIFLGIKNVTDEGRLDLSEIRHVSEAEFPKWTRRVKPQKDDIVFSYEATLHRYARIPEDFEGCLGRRMALVRPDPRKVDSRFLHYFFLSPIWRAKMDAITLTGATVNRIPLTIFPDIKVVLPGLNEQVAIAQTLSAYDDLIENNRRRIALLEEAARLLYREWFVHLRFPGHEHARITEGLPEGWKRLPASEAFKVNPKTPRDDEGQIRYLPMAALSETGMLIDRAPLETRQKSTSVRFRNGDTLFARITPCLENGKTGFVQWLADGEVACGSTEFIVLRGQRVSNHFVYLTARQHDFRENAIRSMIGSSGRQRVQPSCFERYIVPVPPRVLGTLFDEAVAGTFAQIANLDRQNHNLAQARDLLLPRLMNGEIAV
ncbi:MAG: restriction endonuclease subunit S [Spiribacter salinus]|uniref:Restriction endonuclease subunit S n=1 Tax=Spiribacter salinus TaxID=1335746 RepID=A0A540VP42_9GAMM|nr:MAG: restriction endonuclease subunit S [Spiribacter salinus]